MMNDMTLDLDGVVRAVTLVIGHSLWQGAIVAMALGAALGLLRRSSANLRYALSCAALVVAVALPVATVVATGSWRAESVSPSATSLDRGTSAGADAALDDTAPASKAAGSAGTVAAGASDVMATLHGARYWIFAAWLTGVAALTAIHLAGYRRIRSLRSLRANAPTRWQPVADAIARALGVARRVRLMCSEGVDVPTLVGWLSPMILLPASTITSMTPGELRVLIAHELAHVRRHDYLVNFVQVAAETLLFYHPAVWWMSRRIRMEREHCCDDLAVAVCGDRIEYARALVRMEELRAPTPGFAMRADGGSLAARVRRLIGGNAMQIDRPGSARLGALAAVLLIVAGTSLTFTADPRAQRGSDDHYASAKSSFDVEGEWELEKFLDDRIEMQIKSGTRRDRWNLTLHFEPSGFTGLDYGKKDEFELRRDAGTLYFQGDFRGRGRAARGDGDFGFVADVEFKKELAKRIKGKLKDRELLVLAVEDVTIDYVDDMIDLGYDRITDDELVAMAIHGVTPEFARVVQDRDLDASIDNLIAMRIHDVNEEFMDEMAREGLEYRGVDDLVAWRIHGVTPEFASEMSHLEIGDIDVDDFVAMRIHDVTPDFARDVKERFGRVGVEDLVAMRIHGVTPEFIHEMDENGYRHLSIDNLTAWKIHGVSEDFIEEMRELGYERLKADDLIAFRIHGVTPRFVRELDELGYDDVDADDLVAMRIHGVTPRFIRRLKDKGYDDLSIKDLLKIKIHSIDL